MQPKITLCPPSEAGYGHGGHAPSFDKHAFAMRRVHAVSKESELSFNDFSRMHVQRREKERNRRLPTPEWAMSDAGIREVVLKRLEHRFYLGEPCAGTDQERMAAINDA